MTLGEGMIFEWYGNLLDKLPEFFAKPLGRCVLCNGTWIYIGLFLAWYGIGAYLIPTFVLLFLGIGINYIWTELIGKVIVNNEI
jgi:hypothetical protein